MSEAKFEAFSQAAANNQAPILAQLQDLFSEPGVVLEVGSGTGQHAIGFAGQLPHLGWQPTEMPGRLPLLGANLDANPLANVLSPLTLVVGSQWPEGSFRYGYLANVLHIMPGSLHCTVDGRDGGFAGH